jgi:tripartite-type tricarboxylate transporter receptor subunit TctC
MSSAVPSAVSMRRVFRGAVRPSMMLAAALACCGIAGGAMAQTYPAKTITLTSGLVGGTPEAMTRAILDRIKENTGATVIFDPKPGAGGALALQAIKRAAPDGYTFGMTVASTYTLGPLLNKDIGYEPLKDFVPVTNLVSVGTLMAVRDDSPIKDIRDLIAQAKAKPGILKLGMYTPGNQVWTAMLEERSGAKFLQVPYKTTTDAITATLGGHIDVYYDVVGNVLGQKGKIRALSFGGVVPAPQLPNVPVLHTIYPGVDMLSWFGIVAPAGTPASAVSWMQRELVKGLNHPSVVKMIETVGFTVVGNTSEEFDKAIRAEIEAYAPIVKKYDIKG